MRKNLEVDDETEAVEFKLDLAQLEKQAVFDTLFNKDIWICNTGASSHLTNKIDGATNIRDLGTPSLGHAGTAVDALKTIDVLGLFINNDSSLGLQGTLKEVSYSPKLNFNMLSLSRLLKNGWCITSGDETGIEVEKDGNVVAFDIVIPTTHGCIFACRFVHGMELPAASTESGAKMSIWKAHGLLGHGNEELTRLTAKELGWVITHGGLKPCLHCTKAKAKQKNVSKLSTADKATKAGEWIYLDLSKVTVPMSDNQEIKLEYKN